MQQRSSSLNRNGELWSLESIQEHVCHSYESTIGQILFQPGWRGRPLNQTLVSFALACTYVNSFYRAMHFSAKRGIAIACRLSVRLSVCLSVCDVGEL